MTRANICVRRAKDYLRVDTLRDTEGPLDDVMDFSGWDMRKALELLRRTNPSLIEWAGSPIVYRRTPEWDLFAAAMPAYFNPLSNMHHYLSMALNNWHKFLAAEQVKLKKYFYVLRPVLCCRWLSEHGTVPPVAFEELRRTVLPAELEKIVTELLVRKQVADEKELIERIPAMDTFLLSEMDRIHELTKTMGKVHFADYEPINTLFRNILTSAWPE